MELEWERLCDSSHERCRLGPANPDDGRLLLMVSSYIGILDLDLLDEDREWELEGTPIPSASRSETFESSPQSASTSRASTSRSSIHRSCMPSFLRILAVSALAFESSRFSLPVSCESRTEFKLVCVDMEVCRSAFDSSSACTLRSSRESR